MAPLLLEAQGPPRTLRDSAAALLADSLLDEALASPSLLAIPAHQLSIRTLSRRYTIAGTTVTELASPLHYRYSGDRVALSLSGTPLDFTAPLGRVRGATPVRGRLSLRLGRGDTLQLTGRTASAPGALSGSETAALGSVSTSTVDLESMGIGLPAAVGARAIVSQAVGSVTLALDAGTEIEPRPTGSAPLFWRGRTLTAGTTLSTLAGSARVAVGAEWSRSWADSLDGRNLFPGGGTVALDVTLDGPVGDITRGGYGTLALFYVRPYQNARADQPNRLIPQGQFWGVQGDLAIGVGRLTIAPSASLLHEASTVDIGTPLVPARLTSSGWTMSASTALELPLGRGLVLAPEIGGAIGSVGTATSTTVRTRRGRAITLPRSIDDPVRGLWGGLAVRASW